MERNEENEKISIKEIHETLWRCRDFELSHLWQRSIFLTAFLILCYTGYGSIIIGFLDRKDLEVYNVAACLISTLGIVFSSLWIMMGKGSKAWYERYEQAIAAFESNEKYASEKIRDIGGFGYEQINKYEHKNINNCLFSGSGGAYSPSRINIAIGQISLVIWLGAFLFHILIAFAGISFISVNCLKYFTASLCLLVVIMFFICIFCPIIHIFHSDALESGDHSNAKKVCKICIGRKFKCKQSRK